MASKKPARSQIREISLPLDVKEAIAQVTTEAVAALDNNAGAPDLILTLQAIAERLTSICSEYGIEYEIYEDIHELEGKVKTTTRYLAP